VLIHTGWTLEEYGEQPSWVIRSVEKAIEKKIEYEQELYLAPYKKTK